MIFSIADCVGVWGLSFCRDIGHNVAAGDTSTTTEVRCTVLCLPMPDFLLQLSSELLDVTFWGTSFTNQPL
eukprot:4007857-Amphidinium_carterae.1